MERQTCEQEQMAVIQQRIDRLKTWLEDAPTPDADAPVAAWFAYLNEIKPILGNLNNALSLLATVMAKDYLCARLPMVSFDAARKAQGANGLDIDELTADGRRVVAEIKTTFPYRTDELGAAQQTAFRKDFLKLRTADAPFKYFFVTSREAFDAVRRVYASELPGVTVVLLPSGEWFTPGDGENGSGAML